MKIAIIGTGISGLTAAWLLNQRHEIQVFESDSRIGGHTATKRFNLQGQEVSVDTGFIVCNDHTYPYFLKLMDQLQVDFENTRMSFSLTNAATGLEYAGSDLNSLFAQRSNLVSPAFIGMVRDILRFNKQAVSELEQNRIDPHVLLGDWLKERRYGDLFIENYLIPMGSAIWSTSLTSMAQMPALFFIRFFKNHGLLQIKDRPQWKVLRGGSHSYIKPLTSSFADKIQLNSTITHVERFLDRVVIHSADREPQTFDQVVFACHSDQALALLSQPTQAEKEVLGAIPYAESQVTLHQDTRLMPQRKLAWSAWNYRITGVPDQKPVLSYNMNILQHHPASMPLIVTLNADHLIDDSKVLGRYQYAHPQFGPQSIQAQARWADVNGVCRTWFCGAWWRNGFHEDGCVSGIRVAKHLGVDWGVN